MKTVVSLRRAAWFCFLLSASIMTFLLFSYRPAGAVVINEFPTVSGWPMDIAAGPDGNLWFTERDANKIGRITPAGVVTEFTVPTSGSYPWGITSGPDGNLWFAECYGNQIGRITPAGVITEFPLPTQNSDPVGITKGPDGNLWFTEYGGNNVGMITTAGAVTEFPVPAAGSGPWGIGTGPDGNLWFTEYSGNNIGMITTAGAVTEFPVPTAGSRPLGITAGPDGSLWFTEYSGNRIGRITTGGTITEFTVPSNGSNPWGITSGPDGNLWFAENYWGKIGQITTAGVITEFPVPTSFSEPVGLAAGPDNNLWFAEWNAGKIGQLILATGPSHSVTPSAGPNGSLSPNTPQTVDYGSSISFAVTPDNGYHILSVTGCGGLLSGSTYTTGAVTADCTVTATFAINSYAVTPSAGPNGSISPNTPQTVNYDGTTSFTVTPYSGYYVSSVTGCGGTLSGSTYTTGPITASCTVSASFSMIPPVAGFSGLPVSGPAPLTVNFLDSSADNPSWWAWTFGDGGTSSLENPVYTYQNPGTYTVSLTVSNAGGSNTDTLTNYISVSCPVLPVRIFRPVSLYFSSLQSGYTAAAGGDIIQLQAVTLTESPDLNNGTSVTLKGGYDQCYATNSGTYSTIHGQLTIGTGTVTVENLIIQ